MNYRFLHSKPTFTPIKKGSIPEKVETIIEIARQTAYPYWLEISGKSSVQDLPEFQAFVRSKYKTEIGEIFRHPVRFLESGGDCDDQTIFFLANLFGEKSPVLSRFTILIVRASKFLHISQKIDDTVVDFLPYKWPPKFDIVFQRKII